MILQATIKSLGLPLGLTSMTLNMCCAQRRRKNPQLMKNRFEIGSITFYVGFLTTTMGLKNEYQIK